MTSGECFRCDSPASNTFGNGYICDDCVPKSGGSPSELRKSSENIPDITNDVDKNSVDSIPVPLSELSEVFVPIPPHKKGTRRPRTPENLFAAADPVLKAYLEAGHNYGIACLGDLAVVDADEPDRLGELLEALPSTVWQVSGSRESEHHFLQVPGLDEDIPLIDPETGEDLGHIKGAEQSYVVGPGSIHPSGNRYGPLQGEVIATLDEDELREAIDPFRPDESVPTSVDPVAVDYDHDTGTDFSVYNIVGRSSHPEEMRTEHPFHGSDTGANFMIDNGGETWRCWRHDCTGNALHLVGIEQNVIRCGDWKHGGLDTDIWREIFEKAREAGYDLPEFKPTGNIDPVAVVPDPPNTPAALIDPRRRTWNWQESAVRQGAREKTNAPASKLSIDSARQRTRETIAHAYQYGDRVLIEALPTLGKSFSAIAAAADTNEQITYFTNRGNNEQYARARDRCEEFNLSYAVLPSAWRDCPVFCGEYSAEEKEAVRAAYQNGATAREIHAYAEEYLGHELSCQREGETCGWHEKWGVLEPEDVDVLIGHYSHAHVPSAVKGRTIVFDEFPGDTFETQLGERIDRQDTPLAGPVSHFLENTPALELDDYGDLMAAREDEQRRANALGWFLSSEQPGRDPGLAFAHKGSGHALAPLAAFTLLAGAKNDLGNGRERVDLSDVGEDGWVGVYDREENAVHILRPPSDTLRYAGGIVALDGTPTKTMWEYTLGSRLNDRQVLADDERREYIRDVLKHRYVCTTEYIKPYSSGDHVYPDEDAALFEWLCKEYGREPALITSQNAKDVYNEYEDMEFTLHEDGESVASGSCVRAAKHYGDLLGSNGFKTERLGVVVGSRHFGDGFVKKWAAYAGEGSKRVDDSEQGKGSNLRYTGIGDAIHQHMTEHQTLQAVMRFGRDGLGAVVFVHTNTLPEWVPIVAEGRVVRTRSNGERQMLEALTTAKWDSWRTADLANHPAVEISERQIRSHLHRLAKDGYLDISVESGGYVWRDTGLHRVNDRGEVELEPVDLDELNEDETVEVRRSSNFTWDFRSCVGNVSKSSGTGAAGPILSDESILKGGDPPPDEVG